MASNTRGRRFLALCAVTPLLAGAASCGAIIPPEGPSLLAERRAIANGPSGQRRGPDGYTQLGAFPNSAATQLADGTVGAARNDLATVGAAQNAVSPAGAAAADYQRSVAEAEAARLQQGKDVEAALAVDKGAEAAGPAGPTTEEILREIEGR